MNKWTDPKRTGVSYLQVGQYRGVISHYPNSIRAAIIRRVRNPYGAGITYSSVSSEWFRGENAIKDGQKWCEKKLAEMPDWAL